MLFFRLMCELMNRRELLSLILVPLVISNPSFTIGQSVKCYGKPATVVRIDTQPEEILRNALIHAVMFGLDIVKEPFYLVKFEKPENEYELFEGYKLDGYVERIKPLKRKFKEILAPQRAITI